MAYHQAALLSVIALRVAAIPWAEPMATIGLLDHLDERGWTPKPTPPPMPRGAVEDWAVDGAYFMMPKHFGEMYKRQVPNTCGYDGGVSTSAVTCPSGDGCVTNTLDYALGCCSNTDCILPTGCNDLSDGCDAACQTDSYLAFCGASTAPYCFTRYFVQDSFTTFTAFDCAPIPYTQLNYFSSSSFAIGSSSSSSFALGSISSSTSSFSFFSEAPSANIVTVYKTASANPSPSIIPGNGNGGAAGDNSNGNSNSNSSGGGGSSTPVGAIAGGVVGGVVVIALIIGLILFFRHKSNKKKKQESQIPPQGNGPTSPQPLMQQQYPPPPQSPQPGFYPYAPPQQQGSPVPPYSPTMQQQSAYSGSPPPPQHSPQPPQSPFYGGGGYPHGYQTGDDNNNLAVGGGAAGMASPGMSPASPQPSYMTSGVVTMNTISPQEAVGTAGTQGQGLHENVHEVPAETVNRDVGGKTAGETGATQTTAVEVGS